MAVAPFSFSNFKRETDTDICSGNNPIRKVDLFHIHKVLFSSMNPSVSSLVKFLFGALGEELGGNSRLTARPPAGDCLANADVAHTAAVLAARYGHAELVRRLMREFDLSATGTRACHVCLMCGDPSGGVPFLAAGAKEGVQAGHEGPHDFVVSILDGAVAGGSIETVNMLLAHGEKVDNPSGKQRRTALMLAAAVGSLAMVQHLVLRTGASPKCTDADGKTAFMYACSSPHLEIAQWLMSCSVVETGRAGRPAMLVAVKNGRLETAKWLASCGIPAGASAFRAACKHGLEDIACWVLTTQGLSFDLLEVDDEGHNVFAAACTSDTPRLVKMLLEKFGKHTHVYLHSRGVAAKAPIHVACARGGLAVVKFLVENIGACIVALTDSGRTPLALAAEHGRVEVVEYLLSKVAELLCSPGLLRMLAMEHNGKRVFIDTVDLSGFTPLSLAVAGGHLHVAKLLLAWGANPYHLDADGRSMFHLACATGGVEVAKWLVTEVGLNPRHVAETNETALSAACQGANLETAKWLVTTFGANPNGRVGVGGPTNFMSAMVTPGIQPSRELVKFLASHELTDVNAHEKSVGNVLGVALMHRANYAITEEEFQHTCVLAAEIGVCASCVLQRDWQVMTAAVACELLLGAPLPDVLTPGSLRWFRRLPWLAAIHQHARADRGEKGKSRRRPRLRIGDESKQEDPVHALLKDRRLTSTRGYWNVSGICGAVLGFLSQCCESDTCPQGKPFEAYV